MATTTPRTRPIDWALLLCGIGWVLFLLTRAYPTAPRRSYLDVESGAGTMLRTGYSTDLTQDIIGFRALWHNQDAYPELGPAQKAIGVNYDPGHKSTHPPTAFLLVSPVAWMTVPPGARAWAWMTIGFMAASFYCLGANPVRAIGLGLVSVAWPPVAETLGQLTAIWLLGVCASYRYLSSRPGFSGVMLGIAAATKMAPGVLIVLLVRSKRALTGFIATLLFFSAVLLVMSPKCITAYRAISKYEVPHQFGRPDNCSILEQASRRFGKPIGRPAVYVFLLTVFVVHARSIYRGNLRGWLVMSYLCVAVLPIMWIYSMVPLLFLWKWARYEGPIASLFFVSFLAFTLIAPTWNYPWMVSLAVAWVGVGFIVTGLITMSKPTPR